MMYANLEGLMRYLGDIETGGYDNRIEDEYFARRALADCESRIAAYIIPNTPKCEDQVEAFKRAVYAQFAFEYSSNNQQFADLPSGMKSFTVNGFSATMDNNGANGVSAIGISRTAKAILLLAGLLYRGVDCPC